jgi:iron complex transport system substrate-binding protein
VPPTQGFTPEVWKEETRLFGQALGRETQAEAAIEALEQRAAMLAGLVTTELGDRSGAVLVRWMPQGPMVMSDQLFATGLMQAAGLEVHTASLVAEGHSHSDSLSLENLARIDDDWIFLATLNADGREALEAARSSPAFERLKSVQKEQVVAVDGQLWTSASGPLAAHAILDDLESALLP